MRDLSEFPDAHLRQFDRPEVPPPDEVESVYLIGICGTGMGSLAGLFKQAGYEVSGSDRKVYPPMSTHLASLDIPVHEGYDPDHLEPAPDLVVVGNACRPTHPEAAYAREQGLVQQSFPEALGHFFIRDRRSLVVAGTHGKTTTTALLVHLFRSAGRDPGYLMGGVPQGNLANYELGSGDRFIVEGDEYDSAYFDKRPKFVHYRPASAIVTSMELDHLDLYRDWEEYREAFELLAGLLPERGLLALHGDNPTVRSLGSSTAARSYTYGLAPHQNDLAATDVVGTADGQTFSLQIDGRPVSDLRISMFGRHNLLNALAATAIALDEGLSVEQVQEGLASFPGVKRRHQLVDEVDGIRVVDDFAHHPTAVQSTIEATRQRWEDDRIVAVFQPRSNSSRRKVFESKYANALAYADRVFLCVPPFRHNDHPDRFMDADRLVQMLANANTEASAHEDVDALLPPLVDELRSEDVALLMSNGGFGNIQERLPEALRERTRAARD